MIFEYRIGGRRGPADALWLQHITEWAGRPTRRLGRGGPLGVGRHPLLVGRKKVVKHPLGRMYLLISGRYSGKIIPVNFALRSGFSARCSGYDVRH